MRERFEVSCAALLLFAVPGCAAETAREIDALPSYAAFEATVYPVLLRDCGFSACHGGDANVLQVFGPGRTRLDPATDIAAPPTPLEIEVSYARSLDTLRSDPDATRSLFLSKPLAVTAGGQQHGGTDRLGRNVYSTKAELGYAALHAWAMQVER